MVDACPKEQLHTFVRPGAYKMRNLPPEAKKFLQNPDAPNARGEVRLFLPPSSEGFFLNFVTFAFCGLFALGLWAGMLAVIRKEGARGNKGALFVMLLFAALFTWAAIYAWGGLMVKSVRVWFRRPRFGYWVLKSGILARNRVREIIYLPWEKIVSISEIKMYQKSSESESYQVYPALRIRIEENREAMHYNFSGEYQESVPKDKIDPRYVNLYRYDLSGKDPGEFRMFKNACSDFKPLESVASVKRRR